MRGMLAVSLLAEDEHMAPRELPEPAEQSKWNQNEVKAPVARVAREGVAKEREWENLRHQERGLAQGKPRLSWSEDADDKDKYGSRRICRRDDALHGGA